MDENRRKSARPYNNRQSFDDLLDDLELNDLSLDDDELDELDWSAPHGQAHKRSAPTAARSPTKAPRQKEEGMRSTAQKASGQPRSAQKVPGQTQSARKVPSQTRPVHTPEKQDAVRRYTVKSAKPGAGQQAAHRAAGKPIRTAESRELAVSQKERKKRPQENPEGFSEDRAQIKQERPGKRQKPTKKARRQEAERTPVSGTVIIRDFLMRLAAFILVIFVLFGVVFGLTPMANADMEPAICAGDLMLYYRLERDVKSDDVVVFKKDGTQYTGRIVAKGGDTVEITGDAQLKVNDSIVIENDIFYSTPQYDSDVTYPITLEDGQYFILCDSREGAKDSRQFGVVSKSEIKGKVITIIRRSGI